jgi:hypothetical protein
MAPSLIVDAKNRTVVGHLRWRSQFAPEPARRFTGFHRVNSFDHTLMNISHAGRSNVQMSKLGGPLGTRASIVLVRPFRARRGRSIVIMMFRLVRREDNHSQSPVKAYKRGGDVKSIRFGF